MAWLTGSPDILMIVYDIVLLKICNLSLLKPIDLLKNAPEEWRAKKTVKYCQSVGIPLDLAVATLSWGTMVVSE